MAHLQNYKDNFYYHFGDDEEDRGPHPQHVAAAEKGGSIQEGALSLEDSESQHDNPNKGEHMQPYNSLCPDSDQSNPEPMEVDPQEPSLELAEVQRPQASRHQKQFHFTQWQVQEMEKVFQETQYRDVLKRQELARNFNVPEATVQTWFNNRLAKQRAREKKEMHRSAQPGIPDNICMMEVEKS